MTQTGNDRELRLRNLCETHHQSHLFHGWEGFSRTERETLLDELERVPFDSLPSLLKLVRNQDTAAIPQKIDVPAHFRRSDVQASDWQSRGEQLLRQSAVAAFTVAGGQGTRLGFDGPKGAFPVSPVKHKTLFQLFAEQIIATNRRYNAKIAWYIMTSDANDDATRAFFAANNHFGIDPDDVMFFKQGSMPAFSFEGKILLESPGHLALSPDGHGGSLLALNRSGALKDMAERGVQHISYFQVDNPLVRCLDPLFIGLHAAEQSEMSNKFVTKTDDFEKVGVFAMCNGTLAVLEYSDFPRELATARNPDGTRRYDHGSIAIHLFSREFVERLTADAANFSLPWHRAVKKVPHFDVADGRQIDPTEPNAVKLEAFVFDALPLAKRAVLLETNRSEEFAPVKNPDGVDSAETSRQAQSQRAARWLTAAGLTIPANPAGEFVGNYEISPLAALDAEALKARNDLPKAVTSGFYLD